ncbi:MAG: hypothetical protein M1504_01700 [Candidatus Marsarchaeota archaeon]|nr:hypothetical protein [Candidatus Marsarchaeota archaeon]
MQQVNIPKERLLLLKKNTNSIKSIENVCNCKLKIESNDAISVHGQDGYGEFMAKSILFAFGRGFEMRAAELLAHDDYYFSYIDLGQALGSEKRIRLIKARIIGNDGRTKIYIERVSGVKLSVYGDTVSFIGTHSQINEAETAVNTLVEGGTHKIAYMRMEAAHRKHKTNAHNPVF